MPVPVPVLRCAAAHFLNTSHPKPSAPEKPTLVDKGCIIPPANALHTWALHGLIMTPDDIQSLFSRSEGEVQPAGGDDDETVLTDEERQYRIAHLRAVLLEAHNAWVSGSEDLDRIAEKLGDGSRLGESSAALALLLRVSIACALGCFTPHTLTTSTGNNKQFFLFLAISFRTSVC